MKHLLIPIIAAFAPTVLSHNVHGILLVNGTAAPEWTYVLDVGPQYPIGPWDYPSYSQAYKLDPIIGPDNENITCGRAAFASAPKTKTADVIAGSEVGFRVSADGYGVRDGAYYPPAGGNPHPVFWHAGPAQVYLSRAPGDDLLSYKGEGDWFKIAYAGPVDDLRWRLWPGVSDFNFTIPRTTPPGRYLMRIEQFMPTGTTDYEQFYVNCAFVNVIGPGGGVPTGFARFPGTYRADDPGLLVPADQEILRGTVKAEDMKLMNYKPPGPAVWTG